MNTLNTTTAYDPWTIGTLNKTAIWSYYVIVNYGGVALCSILLASIIRYPQKNSTDVSIGALLTGCIWMSVTCGSQCLVSVIYRYFYGGAIACQLEAFFHISAILVQFFSVALIAIRAYLIVVKQIELSVKHAFYIAIGIWTVCIGVTYGLSYVSPIYLMTAGTYCFFGFSSPEIAGWLVPMLGVSLATMTICFYKIVCYAKESSRVTRTVAPATEKMALRCLWFIVVLLGGWFFAAVASVYEFVVGVTPEWLVTAVGVAGVTHSVAVPLTYLRTNRYHLETFRRLVSLCLCLRVTTVDRDGSDGSSTGRGGRQSSQKPIRGGADGSKEIVTPIQATGISPISVRVQSLTVSTAPDIRLDTIIKTTPVIVHATDRTSPKVIPIESVQRTTHTESVQRTTPNECIPKTTPVLAI